MAPDTIQYERLAVGELQTNVYIVYSSASLDCLIIDPGFEAHKVLALVAAKQLIPKGIILTHGHIDHAGGVSEIKAHFKVPLMIHADDEKMLTSYINKELGNLLNLPAPPKPDRLLKEGDQIKSGAIRFTVLHTPGHTPGSIVLRLGDWLFAGDTLFQGSVGRTDLPGGNFGALEQSLARLKTLPPELIVLPGHGDISTLQQEIELNPFL
jgi:hydroxyacylglutathione hydrolase